MTADAVGGIWTYVIDVAGTLSTRGFKVTLAVIGPGIDEGKRREAAEAGCAMVDLGHPPEWLADGPDALARGSAALVALARNSQADLVHLNHPALAAEGHFDSPVLAVCHSCVATWWEDVRGTPLPRDLVWQADLIRAGYSRATALVAPSRAFAQATQRAYGLSKAPTVVLNGRAAPPSLPSDEGVALGLTVGRLWDEGKDVATLDRAAALTRTAIRAVGPTTGPNGSSVTLHHLDCFGSASAPAVRSFLAQRPVFLSAARYEPFGFSVLEAAQMGCPLVLSEISTFRELWGGAALFVPKSDSAGFSAALDRLVNEPSMRAALGAAALERSTRFTLLASVDHLVSLYAAVLGRAITMEQAAVFASNSRTGHAGARGGEAA